MGPAAFAVYHALERYANWHTRSTWVGTAKLADVLNMSQRNVQRSLKTLADLKLIRIIQTATVKTYFIVPVPPVPRAAVTPLFDGIEEPEFLSEDDSEVALASPTSRRPSPVSHLPSPMPRIATPESHERDTDDGAYKEEQELLNETQEQDLFNEVSKEKDSSEQKAALQVLDILKLSNKSFPAAMAAVEDRKKHTRLSIDGIVADIVDAANHAHRREEGEHEFLEDFLAEKLSRRVLKILDLPVTNNLISTVKASIKAEVSYTSLPMQDVAKMITNVAQEDRSRGTTIDKFYFEGVKWRSNARVSKAEQRKLDNLEANAKIKQRLRERFGAS